MTSKFFQDPRIQSVTLAIWLVRRRNHSLRLLLFFDRWKRLEVCRSFIGVRLFPMSFFSNVTDSHSGLGGLLLWPLTMIIPLIWTVSITKSKLKVKKHLLKIADDFVYVYLGSAPKVLSEICLWKYKKLPMQLIFVCNWSYQICYVN